MTIEMPLCDAWHFLWLGDTAAEDALTFPAADAGSEITLPHTFAKNGAVRHGLGAYFRKVQTEPSWKNVFLSFDAVDQCCRVLINGFEAARHEGGYSRFRVHIPEDAVSAGSFDLLLLVDNRINEHISPHFGDFTVFGGIPRPVSLLVRGETCFDRTFWGTDGLILRTAITPENNGLIHLEPHVLGHAGNAFLRISILDPKGAVVAAEDVSASAPSEIFIPSQVLWNGREGANLYTVRAELMLDGQSESADQLEIRTGFRTAAATPEGFLLNGQPLFLRGVAKHQDRAGSLTTGSDQEITKDFDIMDELGANAVRLSHYQHPQAAYDECDHRGILCWAEIPMLKMTEAPALQENARHQLTELILQNIHHPSIFCWGIQNEIAMFRDAPFMHEACRELHALAKFLDPDRMTTCANLYPVPPESELNSITDMVGYNYYFGWYYGQASDYGDSLDAFRAVRPAVPVGISEYGADGNPALHSADPKQKDYSEEYQALFHENAYPFLLARPWLWGSFIWNLFDFSSERRNEGGVTGINAKGLVSWDRSLRKDAFYYYQAHWSGKPMLHLCGKRYAVRAADHADFKVYTNLARVILEINDQRIAMHPVSDNHVAIFRNVPLASGENRIRILGLTCDESAPVPGLFDEAVLTRAEAEPESYRLPESGEGAVTNWFLQEEIRKDRFSILNTAQQLLDSPQASGLLRETFPALYSLLTEQSVVPLGLTMKSILARDVKDPDKIGRFNQALQEIPLT